MSQIHILNSKQRPPASPKYRCYTCLSSDRNLNPLKDKCLFNMLCPEMFSKSKANAQYLICWECEFMILKIKQFQGRLMKAHITLKLSLQGISTVVEGLSNLKATGLETINILPQTIPTPILNEEPPEIIKSEVDTVQIKVEESESLCGDYDVLIQPTAIHQLSSGESTDTASETDVLMGDDTLPTSPQNQPIPQKKKCLEKDMPPSKTVKDAIIASTAKVNYTPQKVFINAPIENMTLKGLLEKVTVGVPTPLKAKSDLYLVKDSVPQASSGEVEQKLGLYGHEEDEAACKILNRTEVDTYRDKKRQVTCYKTSLYKCETCIERFNTQKYLDEHNKKHNKANGNFICDVCTQRFPDGNARDEHYKGHFIVYECLKCPYQNHKRLAISDHIRRIHEVSLFACKKCDAVFKTYKELRQHKVKVHYKKVTCDECGKSFCGRFALKAHIVNTHRKEKTECTICKKMVRKASLYTHMRTHTETRDDSAYCVDCETVYKNKLCYEIHLKTSLKHNKVEQLGIKCDHCNEYFTRKTTLREHMDEINDIKYTCDICKKEFITKRRLARHIRSNHEGLKYIPKLRICEICGKAFTNKQTLQNHINSHLGLRPYVCKDCGDTFSYKSALFTHRRLVHKVKRRYEMTS